MYAVSQEFQDKIKAIVRRTYAKVIIDYTDPFLDQSINIIVNENAYTSYPKQTADSINEPFAKIGSLDGTWVLDGTYALAQPNRQIGWWGKQLAGTGGVFVAPCPTLTVSSLARPILSLKVVGDSKRGEYPVNFTIKLYNELNTLLYTETVTGNTLINWYKDITQVTEVTKAELAITKWSHAGRQVKILEFFTSIQETYEGEDIIDLRVNEDREVSSGGLPVGVVSANEISLKLNNFTRKFDVGNKESRLYGLLKANRRIKAWVGIENDAGIKEFVPLGTYWSSDWKAPEDDVVVSTTGRDRMELLNKSTYSTSTVQQNKNFYDLAVAILQDAKLSADEYWVDTELQSYYVQYAYFEEQTHREALRKVVEACLGQCYCSRDGIIRVEGPSYMLNKINDPESIKYNIGPDDYFKKDNPYKLNSIANLIEVETKPLLQDTLKEVYKSNQAVTVTAGQTIKLTVYFNDTPCINASSSLTGATSTSIIATTYYAWGADVTIKNNGGATENVILKINANTLVVTNKQKAIAKDDKSIIDNGTLRYKFPDNPLIQSLANAQTIADKMLQTFKDPRRDVEITWRGNPSLELGDIIVTPDYKEEMGYYYVINQEIEFSGYLRAKISGRRAL